MPFDSQGIFTRVHCWEQDREDDIDIMSDRHDEEDDNFAQGLNNAFCRDGRAVATGNFNLGNNQIKNLADASMVTDAVNKRQLDAAISNVAADVTSEYQTYMSGVLSSLYPIGSIYIGTQSTCPLTTLVPNSTWELVGQDRALWGGNGSNANTNITAGLPNITGSYNHQCLMNAGSGAENGALYTTTTSSSSPQYAGGSSGGNNQAIAFDASRSNSLYGKSSTVQPPAYCVNIWRRTA